MTDYFHAYLRNASVVIGSFDCKEPFHTFLKNYFRKNKKFGSRDRKIIADLCYGFFRMGNAVKDLPVTSGIIAGYYLTHQADNGFLNAVFPSLYPGLHKEMVEKLKDINSAFPAFNAFDIFPFSDELSPGIDPFLWGLKHLVKPGFFLRIRPGMSSRVIEKLNAAQIEFDLVGHSCIRLDRNIELEDILALDKECVVQDIASQQTGTLLESFPIEIRSFWDACAASGGKSIMVHDLFPKARVFASDLREGILFELRRRFSLAGIKAEEIFCNDLSNHMSRQVLKSKLPNSGVDLIIADVPCSGSGTWGRSPEWLSFFQRSSIDEYSKLQQNITEVLCKEVRQGQYLLYITCSVFKKENEDIVRSIMERGKLKLIVQKHFFGENEGGDHLFAALFTSAIG